MPNPHGDIPIHWIEAEHYDALINHMNCAEKLRRLQSQESQPITKKTEPVDQAPS